MSVLVIDSASMLGSELVTQLHIDSVVDATEMKPFRTINYPPPSREVWALLGVERVSMRATLEDIKVADTANKFASA